MNIESELYLLLIHFVQVAIVIALVAPLASLASRRNAHLAHALWALVLIKCVTPPLIASPASMFSWLSTSAYANSASEWSIAFQPSDRPLIQGEFNQQSDSKTTDAAITQAQHSNFEPTGFLTSFFEIAFCHPVVSAWLIVSLLFGAGFVFRLARFLGDVRRLIAKQSPESAAMNQYVQEVADEVALQLLGQRKVKVHVLDRPIGPAIVGLMHPTVLLPRVVVAGCTKAELESLIGHELVHFRRGDLWWSVVQAFAVCLAWGNPLVWVAARKMSDEAEKCCDEQTISGLGICPKTYAHCLISVLERKQTLEAAPLLPGVRPVDITTKRLERIMRVGQGSQCYSSRWVLATLLVGANIILPGAALSLAQEEKQDVADSRTLLYKVRILQLPTAKEKELYQKWSEQKPAPTVTVTESVDENLEPHDAKTPVVAASFSSAAPESTANFGFRALTESQISDLISDAETLSVPKVIAPDGTAASISLGEDIPFVTSFEIVKDENGKPTKTLQPQISFAAAGIRLELVGNLSKDRKEAVVGVDFSQTELLEVEEFTFELAGQEATVKRPKLKSLSVETTLKLPIGETIALQCGTQRQTVTSEQSIPVVSSIPYLGKLFKNTAIGTIQTSTVLMIECEVCDDIVSSEAVANSSPLKESPQQRVEVGQLLPIYKQPNE